MRGRGHCALDLHADNGHVGRGGRCATPCAGPGAATTGEAMGVIDYTLDEAVCMADNVGLPAASLEETGYGTLRGRTANIAL